MKSKTQFFLTIACLVPLLQLRGIAQNKPQATAFPNYDVISLGTPLGGSFAIAEDISTLGIISGYANLPGDETQHIILSWGGFTKDMGTLGGPDSAILGNFSGFSEPDTPDPLGQDFCEDGYYYICLPVTVEWGKVHVLPLLGGLNGVAYANNNVGEVVGISQTTVIDDGCLPNGWSQQMVPVYWKSNQVHALPRPSGDMEGFALGVNDSGQIVGTTGNCSSNQSAHAVLWNKGKLINLGTFGGSMNNGAYSINDQGDVTGGSDLAGDATGHAFLWRKGVLTDLGTLPGDYSSYGNSINDSGEIVGESCDINNNCRFFLWKKGAMTDLGTLTPPSSPLFIQSIALITDRGALVGYAYDSTTGLFPAILAVPDYAHANQQAATDSAHSNSRVGVPPNDRGLSRRAKPGHFLPRTQKP